MDSANDSRFDPNFLAQLLAETAHERSVEDLLKKLVARMSERPDTSSLCSPIPFRAA